MHVVFFMLFRLTLQIAPELISIAGDTRTYTALRQWDHAQACLRACSRTHTRAMDVFKEHFHTACCGLVTSFPPHTNPGREYFNTLHTHTHPAAAGS